ncbi:MAG: dephospho-CoA kinase, partial [Desulfobacterales bacterium]
MKTSASNIIKVAVTGGAGSGKTSVCNQLKKLGAHVISSDAIAREAVAKNSPAYKNIVNYFGKKVLLNDGELNRQMLRRIIINNDTDRSALEKIMHPEITKKMMLKVTQAKQAGDPIVFLEIPLLFELGMEDQFDAVIMISTELKLRIKRLMGRDNVTHNEAETLINVQMPDEVKVACAQFVLTNNGSKKQLI